MEGRSYTAILEQREINVDQGRDLVNKSASGSTEATWATWSTPLLTISLTKMKINMKVLHARA